MKRFVLAPLVFAAALVAGSADAQDSAQSYGYQDRYGDTYQDGYLADDRYYDDRYGDRYEDRYDDRYDDRYGYARTATPDRYGRDGTYDTARVLRVEPMMSRGGAVSRRECVGGYDDRYAYGGYGSDPYRQRARTSGAGALIGAVIGGAIGNAVADDDRRGRYYGDPRYGQGYYGQPAADCRYVGGYGGYDGYDRGRVDAYRVTYEYAGRVYQTVTDYPPGERLRVRVDVRPQR